MKNHVMLVVLLLCVGLGFILFSGPKSYEEAGKLCYPGVVDRVDRVDSGRYLLICADRLEGEKKWVMAMEVER